ncbi:two-partner secretion domain-containing protein [Fischerella sp. PCC 9605]|uniref:two-partner secretion domain-containing protein n=1 Tax=Fischerella sp. PCC 9605 TaxID=1173024 RepID=UPI0004BCE7F6|nr:S-layer family protein [Fischerella sp. PCC 9605]
MKPRPLQLWLLSGSTFLFAYCCKPTAAQIVPDATLPVDSAVTQQGNTSRIEGGTTVGTNLFHSFDSFSIPTDSTAFFNNTLDIQNIISRVTGKSISNIDGLIQANGTANLFLINPNGIVFGANARLNVGGSFLASTANSINFADGTQIGTTSPQTTPLLTVSTPIGLQFGQNSGSIKVQGTGYDLSVATPRFSPIVKGSRATGLRVSPGKTLALVGGDVDVEGGTLTAEQGRIDLGSVDDGQVSLTLISSGFALNYQGVKSYRDIRLSQQSLADASGGGAVQVQGNNVALTDGSLILIQNQGQQQGGSISVNTDRSLEESGTNSNGMLSSGLRSETTGDGTGADIAIFTPVLAIRNGGAITTRSYGAGKTGNVSINASESVQVIGHSPADPFVESFISAVAFSSGDAGDISLSTGKLSLFQGGRILSATFSTGNGGDVTVNARNSIEAIGVTNNFSPSNLSALTFNGGDAGRVTINTSKLLLRNGGAVSTSTLDTGDAGSIVINATESVEIGGRVPQTGDFSIVRSSAPVVNNALQRAFRLPPVPKGVSGDVTIKTQQLKVTDGARIDARNDGPNNAGTLRVDANYIFLERDGGITAATASGEGGNIQLVARDLLLLRDNSSISASADGNGNGGNISINTPLLVTVAKENSDISANSVNSRGGNVTINTSGLFGIQFRETSTSYSDITATGANSELSGTVRINTPDLDPSSGLVELPAIPIDSTKLIAQGCPANQSNRFIITGRGGLPPLPSEALRTENTVPLPWVTLERQEMGRDVETRHGASGRGEELLPKSQIQHEIVEANGWVVNKSGEVVLTASAPTTTALGSWLTPPTCP